MPRPPRVDYRGAFHHVAVNGNNRQPLFLTPDDRRLCLALLGETAERYRWEVRSYCLMDTHWHLLVRTPETTSVRRYAAAEQLLRGLIQPPASAQRTLDPAPVHVGRRRARVPRARADALPPAEPRPRRADTPSRGWFWSSYRLELGRTPAPSWLQAGWSARLHGSPEAAAPIRHRRHGGAGRPVDARLRPYAQSSSTGGMNGSSAPGLGVRSSSSPSVTAPSP